MTSFAGEGSSVSSNDKKDTHEYNAVGIDVEPNLGGRGGACTAIISNSFLILFGGGDRKPSCMSDLWKYTFPNDETNDINGKWECIPDGGNGEVPMARTESSMISYDKYVFLFGGIDMSNLANVEKENYGDDEDSGISLYNELYVLNTETWEWKYVGESGCEIDGRSNHSLNIVETNLNNKYLVLFGGAHPEKGPNNDTYIAKLPPTSEGISVEDFFVKWEKVETELRPTAREMHASCTLDEKVYISGGKIGTDLFDDVWQFSIEEEENDNEDKKKCEWKKVSQMSLKTPRCGHGMVTGGVSNRDIIIFGGVLGTSFMSGISIKSDFIAYTVPNEGDTFSSTWKNIYENNEKIRPRFASSLCSKDDGTLIVFGGVNETDDYGDIIILNKK